MQWTPLSESQAKRFAVRAVPWFTAFASDSSCFDGESFREHRAEQFYDSSRVLIRVLLLPQGRHLRVTQKLAIHTRSTAQGTQKEP